MSVLTGDQIERFVRDGVVHLEAAFSPELAAECVDALWPATGVDRRDPSTWVAPVVRIASSFAPPLVQAVNAERLSGALDDLIGAARWRRLAGYGGFVVRFPSADDPADTGWHIDGSFEIDGAPPPWNYGVDVWSRNRALLLLMLFTDVGPDDAPTRVRVGSHCDMARTLARFGVRGASILDAMAAYPADDGHDVALATGRAGDVYLCHPFTVHAASWPHRGSQPRFLGQPCIFHAPPADRYHLESHAASLSPCARSIVEALAEPRLQSS